MDDPSEFDIDRLMRTAVEEKSDLHLAVGEVPVLKNSQGVRRLDHPPLDAADCERFMRAVTPDANQNEFEETGATEFGFAFSAQARFRIAVFRHRRIAGIVFRRIPTEMLPF